MADQGREKRGNIHVSEPFHSEVLYSFDVKFPFKDAPDSAEAAFRAWWAKLAATSKACKGIASHLYNDHFNMPAADVAEDVRYKLIDAGVPHAEAFMAESVIADWYGQCAEICVTTQYEGHQSFVWIVEGKNRYFDDFMDTDGKNSADEMEDEKKEEEEDEGSSSSETEKDEGEDEGEDEAEDGGDEDEDWTPGGPKADGA